MINTLGCMTRMTKQELISRQKAMTRSSNRWNAAFLFVLLGWLLGNVPLANFMDREKPGTWIQVLYYLVVYGFLFGHILLIILFAKRQTRQFGLQCPSCGK